MLEPLLLINSGFGDDKNLCFVNSVIQFLRQSFLFKQHLIENRNISNVDKELYNLVRNEGTTTVVSAAHLRMLVGIECNDHDIFSGEQQDAAEFLCLLLQCLYPASSNMFNFKLTIESKFLLQGRPSPCQHCGRFPSNKDENHNILKVAFPSISYDDTFLRLEHLLEQNFGINYSSEGQLKRCEYCCTHGDNSDHQSDVRCRLKEYQSQSKFTEPPSCLIIQLLRFRNIRGLSHKINTLVKSPDIISIEKTKYYSTAILNHEGNLEYGHYRVEWGKMGQRGKMGHYFKCTTKETVMNIIDRIWPR